MHSYLVCLFNYCGIVSRVAGLCVTLGEDGDKRQWSTLWLDHVTTKAETVLQTCQEVTGQWSVGSEKYRRVGGPNRAGGGTEEGRGEGLSLKQRWAMAGTQREGGAYCSGCSGRNSCQVRGHYRSRQGLVEVLTQRVFHLWTEREDKQWV